MNHFSLTIIQSKNISNSKAKHTLNPPPGLSQEDFYCLSASAAALRFIGPPAFSLTYQRADGVVALPQLGYLSPQHILALQRHRRFPRAAQSFIHLLQHRLPETQQRLPQVGLPAAPESSIRPMTAGFCRPAGPIIRDAEQRGDK